jgi:hypothetical protein
MVQSTGLPIAEGLTEAFDIPHTVSFAIIYRSRINSLQELPKDKRPPRNLWDKPHRLDEFLDDVFERDGGGTQSKDYVEFNMEEVE